MTVTRTARESAFLVDYSTLVIRDSGAGTEAYDERLCEDVVTLSVTGRLAMAGQGWLRAHTRADHLDVVLELHDAPPAREPVGKGVELMETPYRSPSGEVVLDSLVPMAGCTSLQLDGPGLYRVRVRKEPDPELERWRLSFWRDAGEPEPPQWFALTPRGHGATALRSWRSVLPYEAIELLDALQGGPEVALTTQQYAAYWVRHGRRRDYLEDVLLPERPARTTGFPDIDAGQAQGRDRYDEERRATWTNLSGQLGVGMPRTRGDLLELLVAGGLLTRGPDGAYTAVPDPPHPHEVLQLPAEHLGREARQQQREAHGDLAADVERFVLWSPGRTHRSTLDELADHLLTTPTRLRGALAHAEQARVLVVERGLTGVVLTLPEALPSDGEDDDGAAWDDDVSVQTLDDVSDWVLHEHEPLVAYESDDDDYGATLVGGEPPRPPREVLRAGAPPRWGVVVGGRLWRWTSDGVSSVPLDDPWCDSALRTAGGTLLLHAGTARLVDDDGQVHDLGRLTPVALDRAGRLVAGIEARYGRQRSTFRLHAVDAMTRERVTMPWPGDRQIRDVAVDTDGSIVFRAEPDPEDPASDDALHRWRPGQDPVREPATDGLPTRTGLRTRWDEQGLRLTWPSGSRQHYAVDGWVRPAPLASLLYSLRGDPPAVALWHLEEGAPVKPRVLPLPEGANAYDSGPGRPVWESATSLLLTVRPYVRDDDVRALRLDALTGQVERVDVPEDETGVGSATFVEGQLD